MAVRHITCEHLLRLKDGEQDKAGRAHVVLDLRDPLEFESGHIEGSVNVPRKELESNITNVVPLLTPRVIVVVGPTNEQELQQIHDALEHLGYPSVEFLAGGFDKWCEIAAIDKPDENETPEEEGFTGDVMTDIDPEAQDNEPLY